MLKNACSSTKLIIELVLLFVLAANAQSQQREIVSLDGQWDFAYTRSSAQEIPDIPDSNAFDCKIRIPGGWDAQLESFKNAVWQSQAEFKTTNAPLKYLAGIGWYRRSIQTPMEWKGRTIRLTIGWPIGVCNVWLNGQHISRYDYGVYTPYEIDLTNAMKFGQDNELIISVDNVSGWAGSWAFCRDKGKASGITRSIALEVTSGAGIIDDLYVRPGADLKEVLWQLQLNIPTEQQQGPSKIYWEIWDKEQKNIVSQGQTDVNAFSRTKQVVWKTRIDSLKPWSPKDPQLYWAKIIWKDANSKDIDIYQQRFGMRHWSIDGRKLYLNGKQMYMRGEFAALTFPITGMTETSKEYWIKHIERARSAGMNYINFAARIPPLEMMEAADELGMIIQTGDDMTVLKQYNRFYEEVWRPIIKWTRRYPSVGIYGFGGERNYYDGVIEQYQKQYDLIKSMNPECLVMPQQAIRGIDYSFDDAGKKELTREPFPHHAARLAQYTKACDLFGHFSGGAFGYKYFDDSWQEMEKRFRIYDKPLIMHELFMGASYLNPDNIAKYTGWMRPYQYLELKENLKRAGLENRWKTYWVNSCYLQRICKKYCVEKVRKCNDLAGFEFLGLIDELTMWYYSSGILDEFLELKPGDTFEDIRRYMGQSVLLLDFNEIAAGSINRSYLNGEEFRADIMVSLYESKPVENGKLIWELKSGDKIFLNGNIELPKVANGCVSTIHKLQITWPQVEQTTQMNLSVRLEDSGYNLANDWDFWVFPKFQAPAEIIAADENSIKLLSGRYNVKPLAQASQANLHILSKITAQEANYLAQGGSVLLLGTAPFEEYNKSTLFRSGLACRKQHNVGSVMQQHPIFAFLPHQGWGDWQFYPVIEGAPCIILPTDMNTPFDPIIEFISQPCEVRREAAIFEKNVGKGRLLVSTCVYNQNNPSCVAMMDGMVKYMQSGKFQPASELPVSVLMGLINSSRSSASSGTAAQTDISHKPEESEKIWHNKAVTVEIPQGGWVSVNNGKWVQKREVIISSEGTAKVFIKKTEKDTQPEIKEVCIDMTPPVIILSTEPALEQEGGVYFGTEKTLFAFNVSEPLSGIRSIEFATDGNGNRLKPYTEPFKLPPGSYGIRCRVTDNAGNVSEIMGGDVLSGGSTDVVVLNIKK